MIFGALAFDYIGNNLYMSNLENTSIEVFNERTLTKTVFYFDDIPGPIVLVPEEGYDVELIILIIYQY